MSADTPNTAEYHDEEPRIIKQKTYSRASQIFSMLLFFFVLIAIPVTAWLAQEPTNIIGEAFFEKPLPLVLDTEVPAVEQDAEITLVWPFLGKVGDAVLIQGVGFGDDQGETIITFGGVEIGSRNINQWTPELIEITIPELPTGTITDSTITIERNDKESVWIYPFTIYNTETDIQVKKPNGHLEIDGAPPESGITMYFEDGTSMTKDLEDTIIVPAGKTILSLMVLSAADNPMSFYVEPLEFGF